MATFWEKLNTLLDLYSLCIMSMFDFSFFRFSFRGQDATQHVVSVGRHLSFIIVVNKRFL